MMGARLRYGLIGAVFFVVGLIVYLPASLVTGWVAGATELRFDGVTGTAPPESKTAALRTITLTFWGSTT